MAFKAIIDSLDSVEEQFRSLYEEQDGKHFVAKPTGGDAGGSDGKRIADNPWDSSNGKKPNLTRQQQLMTENPAKARQLAQAAGVTPTW
ncbi:hypothetical protein [Pelagibacterium sp. H642]|uniref:hypothetical protein n=1 Tax=Pelagibacterium sp. H642 TaxID=1881069 RepID=UPI0028164F33|nr:hypothetical protein [Pelagibacterium sp. H642]WMT92800.1 hypothetical protein NO934_18640 [Pelagibacterium sp. H642]